MQMVRSIDFFGMYVRRVHMLLALAKHDGRAMNAEKGVVSSLSGTILLLQLDN